MGAAMVSLFVRCREEIGYERCLVDLLRWMLSYKDLDNRTRLDYVGTGMRPWFALANRGSPGEAGRSVEKC